MSSERPQSSRPDLSRLTRLLKYLEQDGDNLRLRKDAICQACNSGLWTIARDLIDGGLEAAPAHAELLAWRGAASLKGQRYETAEAQMSAAVALGLETAEIRYNLACAHFMQRHFDAALKELSAPLLPFELPRALKLRARCQHFLGQLDAAINSCRLYLRQVAQDPEAHGLLALLLYDHGEHEAARGHVEVALAQDQKQQEGLLTRASLQFDSAEYESARRTYEELIRAHPQCGRGWLGLGLIKLKDMQLQAAKHDIEVAANQMPDHIGTWHVLAWIHLLLGDVLSAELAFDKALELDRNFGESHGGLAVVAALEGRLSDARLSIKRALRLNPQALSARYAEWLILRQQDRIQEADALLQQVLSRPVSHGDMQYRDLVSIHTKHLQRVAGRALP
jgi:tetratricopeptide (TPR) repeat protein